MYPPHHKEDNTIEDGTLKRRNVNPHQQSQAEDNQEWVKSIDNI